jgi:hypothetical protein
MKFYSHKFFFLLFSLNFLSFYLFISCGEPNSRKDKGQDLIETKRLNEQKVWEASSELFRKITKSSQGLIRGVNLGQNIKEINEDADLSEVQPNQGRSYTQYLDDSDVNFVDITYLTNSDGKILQITLDIFLDEREEVGELMLELRSYFDVKLGKSQSNNNKTQWLENKNTQVVLENVSSSKDPGIKILFSRNL